METQTQKEANLRHLQKRTIFQILNDKEICYAVGVNMNTFIGELDNCSRDYFIIIHEKDLLDGIQGFHEAEDYRNICERTLTEKEIQEIKKDISKYILTMQNDSGRIYELANNSFKAMYDENRHVFVESVSKEPVNT